MKERASEPSHLRPPLDSLTFNSNNHSSHAAMQRNQQNDEKAERFDAPLFQPLFTSYMQIQYFFYDVEILCTLLPWCSRVIRNHSVISDSYRTVPTSTKPYCTAQRDSTAQNSPVQSIWCTRTVLSPTNAPFPTAQSLLPLQSATVQSSTVLPPTVLPPTVLTPSVQSSTVQLPTVQPSTVQLPTVQPSTVQPPTVQFPTMLPTTMLPSTVQSSTVTSFTVQPPTMQMQFQMRIYLPKIEIFPHYSHPPYHAWMCGDDVL